MSIYRLDLDALEETKNEYEVAATKTSENVDTSYTVIGKTNIDIFSGIDGNTFRTGFNNFVSNDFTQLYESISQMKTILTDGLDDARGCKKICNDFIISLGGESTGKSEADIHGEFYCDQSVIEDLIGFCRLALDCTDPIRTICFNIEDTLFGLRMVKLNPTPYTCVIREGCDKVDRLDNHSRELVSYASKAEMIDDSFKSALDGFSAPFLLDFSLGIYTSISPQAENIIEIMSQKADLTDDDKKLVDENLRIMEENGDIKELQKIAEHVGNGEDGAWTEGDIYVVARVYKYAENNANAELATIVYNKMKKIEHIEKPVGVHTDSPQTIFKFEIKLDEDKVSDILGQLDPEKDGSAYYSLQRRSKYVQKIEKTKAGSNPEVPEMDFDIVFEKENGKLVSVFTVDGKTVRLASVDMNDVIGEEGKRNLDKLGYSKEERIALMSSIYTDEDISLIGDLARAKEEEDYRDVFQNNPNHLSTAVKAGLYNYSVKLMDSCVKYDENMMITSQNFEQFENFTNGLLYKKTYIHELQEDNRYNWIYDYRDDYLELLITYGEIQMELLKYPMKENYKDKEYILDNLAVFAENTQILSLYATLDHRLHDWHKTGNGLYANVSGLMLEADSHVGPQDFNINNMMFSYHETIMEDEKPYTNSDLYDEGLMESNIQIIKLTGSSISDIEEELAYAERARAVKWAIPKAVFNEGMVALSAISNTVNNFMAVKDVISNGTAVSEQFRQLEEKEKSTYCRFGGAYIGYSDDGSRMTILLEGQYDANALLKMSRLENEGYAEMAGVNQSDKDEISKTYKTYAHTNIGDDQKLNYGKYLLWTGEVCENKYGEPCDIQTFSDIPPNDLSEGLREFDGNNSVGTERFRYDDYNMINEYYLGDKGK